MAMATLLPRHGRAGVRGMGASRITLGRARALSQRADVLSQGDNLWTRFLSDRQGEATCTGRRQRETHAY